MQTPRYRIGNDLSVFWAIHNRDGSPFNMENMCVRLFVTNDRERKEVQPILTTLQDGTTNNVVRWDYKGDDQRVLGLHTLTIEISDSNRREITKDYCDAFTLVSTSDLETEEDDANISSRGDLILASKLDIYRFEMTSVDVGDIKDSINDIVNSMADVNEALRDINTEAINIKTTINGIQQEVNDFGTELTTKASVESIIEIGELITEVQTNAIDQTMRVDALGAEVKTKATAESVTTIADQLEITNKSVAEQTLKVDDLSAEIATKASQQMVVELGDSLKTVTDTVAEQTLKVDALGAEVATKASLDYAAELAGGIEATNKVVAEQTLKVSDLTSEIANRATVESVTKLSDALSTTTDAVAEQKIRVDGLESEISSKAENETVLAIDGKVTNVSSNLAEQTIRVDGLEASIENTVSKEDFNAATGQLNESYASLKQTTDGLDATIKTNSGEITSIKQNIDGLSVSIKTVSDDLKAIENKIDGVTESYFLPYAPTLENEPAATWIEEGSEESHLGDTFTSTETEGETAGKSWRWLETDGVWGWVPIADTDAQKALLLASQAKEAVDGKVTIFYEQPSNYKEGDIWFVHNDNYSPYPEGEILSAIKGNATFDILDWESKTSYSKTISELDTKMNTTFKDGVLDEAERKVIADGLLSLNQEKASLDYEYNIVVGNANFYDAELKAEYKAAKDAYDEAYNELVQIIGNIVNAQEDELQDLFDSYKTASESYGEAYSNYVRSKEQVSEALSGRLNPANIYIGHIASDGYLTPIEKEQMFEIYRSLAKEYNTAKGNAYNYKIWQYAEDGETEEAGMNGTNGRYETYVEYKESFVPIVSVFTSSTWGFDKMSETTELPEGSSTSTIKEYLDTYYECLGALSEIFSAITISIQEAQKRGEETLAELTNILAPEEMDTKIGKGVVLSTIIATKDTQGNITAGMNASNEFSDATHKRVVIAGGVNDKTDWNDSEFRLYEDGHFVAKSGELGENVKIGNALITSVLYGDINLLSYPENGKLIPLFTIEKDANGKISSVSSAYDFKVNGNLLVYGESATRAAGDPSTGGGIDKNKLEEYLRDYKYINEDALLEYNFADEAYVNSEIAKITPSSLGVYTTSEVDAKVDALGIPSLKEKVEGIESTLGDDVSGKINTWNEIVNFLDEYNGSEDLETILTKMQRDINSRALGSDLNETIARVADNEDAIEDLQDNKADKNNVYTKEQTYDREHIDGEFEEYENALATKALKSEVYTKEETYDRTYIDGEFEDVENALAVRALKSEVYTKEDIDGKVDSINDSIENLDKNKADKTTVNAIDERLKAEEDVTKTYAAWWKDLMTYVKVENGNVVIDTNLLVEGESATRGVGDPSTGGGLDENRLAEYLEEYKYINEDALLEYGYATEQDVNNAIDALNIGDYAKTSEVERLFTALNIGQYAKTVDVNAALSNKVDKVSGKGLSTNDFTTALLNKLNAIAEGAEVNVQSDWNATSGDAFIKNKPTFADVATSGSYNDLSDKPTIPTTMAWTSITDKPTFALVATSGKYSDLLGAPALAKVAISGKYSDLSDTPDLSVYALTDDVERLFTALNISQYAKTADLGSLAFVNSLSKADVGLGNVANETYAGGTAVTLNGFSKAKSTASFYAPTSAGTVGYFLKSQGAGDAPIWSALGALATKDSLTYSDVGVTKDVITSLIGTTTYAAYNANGYLSLGGGTIEGVAAFSFKINYLGSSSYTAIPFYKNGTMWGALGMRNDEPIFINAANDTIRTLIHSGNYSSYALPLSGGRITGNSITIGKTDNYNAAYATIAVNASTSADYGTYIRHYHSSSYKGLLITKDGAYYSDGSSNNTLIHSGNIGSQSVASATYASTARALVDAQGGKSVAYVSGNTFYIGDSIYPTTSTQILGNDVRLRYGANASFGFWLNSSGNVTIGASDLASTNGNPKLYVDGAIRTSGAATIGGNLQINPTSKIYLTLTANSSYGYIQALHDGVAYLPITINPSGGNVGIGTTSPAYKLDVSGTARVSGATTLSSTLSVGGQTTINNNLIVYGESASTSDMRFKDVVENKSLSIADIAKAPCFSFTWKEKDDKSLHLGTSAQYWEAIAPELVTGEDFKALNYASLGVAMGIALAKESINHEDRIKNLEDEIKILNGELKRLRYGIHQ